jgi:hypothetical protein
MFIQVGYVRLHILVLMECLHLVFQHHEGIYWYPTPLRDEDQRSYKVREVADVQAAPPQSTSTSPTRRWGVTTRHTPRLVGRHPRSSHRDARGRQRGRYPPPKPRDPGRGGEEEEGEADQVRGVGGHHHN